MKKKYLKILLNFLGAIFLLIFQLFFLSSFPNFLNKLNLILIVLLFVLIFSGFKTALFWALFLGFLLDIYLFLPFGVHLISIIFSLCGVNFLLVNFFTNRSLYSFLFLAFFIFIFYEFCKLSLIYFWKIFSGAETYFIFNKSFWIFLSQEIILNLLIVFLFFYVVGFFAKKLQPVFLLKTEK